MVGAATANHDEHCSKSVPVAQMGDSRRTRALSIFGMKKTYWFRRRSRSRRSCSIHNRSTGACQFPSRACGGKLRDAGGCLRQQSPRWSLPRGLRVRPSCRECYRMLVEWSTGRDGRRGIRSQRVPAERVKRWYGGAKMSDWAGKRIVRKRSSAINDYREGNEYDVDG
jgi:hypothetical protein